MVRNRVRAVGCLVGVTFGLAGCYAPATVDPQPGPWRIDDFEGGSSGYPLDPLFEPWECRPMNASHPIAPDDCNVTWDADGNSNALHLGAALYSREDSGDTYTRAEVATFAPSGRDLTSYARLTFRAKLQFRAELVAPDPARIVTPLLKVQLLCTGVPQLADRGVSSNPCVLITAQDQEAFTSAWQSHDIDMAVFRTPEALGGNAPYTKDECLATVDAIKITVDSNIGNGVSSGHVQKFDLYVDDVAFMPKP